MGHRYYHQAHRVRPSGHTVDVDPCADPNYQSSGPAKWTYGIRQRVEPARSPRDLLDAVHAGSERRAAVGNHDSVRRRFFHKDTGHDNLPVTTMSMVFVFPKMPISCVTSSERSGSSTG